MFACLSESPFAALVAQDCIAEVLFRIVGPECVGENQLGVCNLPQQVVAHTAVAAGAYHQVGVGDACRCQMAAYCSLVDAVGVNLAFGKKVRVGNMLPALIVPMIYRALMSALGYLSHI